jgi:hypothetical protein
MIQDGLNDLRKTGLNGRVIAAFAQVDSRNMADVKLAVYEFGAVDIGFYFPASAMDQFNNGQPWDVVSGSPIEGGHCVLVVGYDDNYLYVYTWGAIQRMTYAFWSKYVDEAWVLIDGDWISAATGVSVSGIDKAAFGAQFAALTGLPNPFPDVPPVVPPVVVLDVAETALVAAARRYLKRARALQVSYLSTALKAWLKDKGQ